MGDLLAIRDHYHEQGVPHIGNQFVEAILRSVQRLRDHPDSGRKVPEFDQEHIREIIHPPFRVVYLRDAASIELIRVWRSERLLSLPDDEAWRETGTDLFSVLPLPPEPAIRKFRGQHTELHSAPHV